MANEKRLASNGGEANENGESGISSNANGAQRRRQYAMNGSGGISSGAQKPAAKTLAKIQRSSAARRRRQAGEND